MKIANIVGARPNFMKIAPIMEQMKHEPSIDPLLVHTGQHYDEEMSKLFFDDLELPRPDIDLEVGSASHAVQTAEIMRRIEPVLLSEKPDLVLVVGDVNSTIACALVAAKLHIKIAHVEAGLRSYDRRMPEEINRVLTDAVSDYLFTTDRMAHHNLAQEGISEEKIYFVGNVMIDTLLKNREKAKQSNILNKLGFAADGLGNKKRFAVLTLHRPSNVDKRNTLERILTALDEISRNIPIIFPAHPRTRRQIHDFGFNEFFKEPGGENGLWLINPLGYLDFMQLMSEAHFVLTDSGGIQEETTVLGIPCITMRENTERPITVTEGTNVIVGTDKQKILDESEKIIRGNGKSGKIPEFWDGKAAERIVNILII
jgi:UDP-N-acetylglucosamine 2-epimerase (non-hydrolysing)